MPAVGCASIFVQLVAIVTVPLAGLRVAQAVVADGREKAAAGGLNPFLRRLVSGVGGILLFLNFAGVLHDLDSRGSEDFGPLRNGYGSRSGEGREDVPAVLFMPPAWLPQRLRLPGAR